MIRTRKVKIIWEIITDLTYYFLIYLSTKEYQSLKRMRHLMISYIDNYIDKNY